MQTTSLWRNIIRFVFLVLLQGIALEHISLPGNLHWILYPLFVVLLPLQTPAVAVLLASFAAGFCVDLLCGVPGLNAAAATLAATRWPRPSWKEKRRSTSVLLAERR